MWFKNLQLYRLPAPWDIGRNTLDTQLRRRVFRPCGPQDGVTCGWLSPAGDGLLVHQVGGQWLIALGVEQRLLPQSVINKELETRAQEFRAKYGYDPDRKWRHEFRGIVRSELLPKAFTQTKKIHAWIDPVNGWLGVDASSPAKAEVLIEVLRDCLDSLPLALVRTKKSTVTSMTDWLLGEDPPAGFTIDRDCELRSFTGGRSSVVRYINHDLSEEEISKRFANRKLTTRLALTFDDRLSFMMTDKFEIKRLDYLDLLTESMDKVDSDDAQAVFDAGFALMTGELRRMIPALIDAMGGEEVGHG